MEANHDYALWQTLGHWTGYVEWFVALVVAAAVASAWRGAWLLLDAGLWPQRPSASAALGLGWGVVLFGILGFAQPCLASAVGRARHKQIFWLVDAIYSYLGFWCCVLVWRGVWQLWDGALGLAPVSNEDLAPGFVRGAWLSHCVGVALLLAAGAMRSLNAPPTLILADNLPPMFGARSTSGLSAFRPLLRFQERPPLLPCRQWHEAVGLPYHAQDASPQACEITPEANCASLGSPNFGGASPSISNLAN